MNNELILDNHVIKKDIRSILSLLRSQITNGKLSDITYKQDQVSVTCPFHSEGQEKHPSCSIYIGDEGLPWGTFHCFTCGEKGSLVKFIASCLEVSNYVARKWLKTNFTEKVIPKIAIDEPIKLNNQIEQPKTYLDESILDKFQSWHPYIEQRHISKEVAKRFDVKYDPESESVVFPVRNKEGKLMFLTRRCVKEKKFYIDSSADKIVYLLYEATRNNYKQVIVAESQINALVAYSYGFPAVALFGAGTTENQIKELNSTEIIHYILMYDNDDAGRRGASRFKRLIRKDVFITDITMPKGKDIADCSKEEFLNILKNNDVSVDFSIK